MGGRRHEDGEGSEGRRPVEPGEAREHGNEPDAVRMHRRGEAGGEDDAEARSATWRGDSTEPEKTGRREEAGKPHEDRGDGGGDEDVEGMGRSDKILIAALAALGVVLLAVILVLSLLRTAEWIQFVLALALFAALGLGAYRYVITPSGRRQESGSD